MNRVYRYKSRRKFSLHDRIVVRAPLSRYISTFYFNGAFDYGSVGKHLFSNVVTRLITERYSIRSIFSRVVKRKYPAQQIRVREGETARYSSLSISVVYRWMKRKIYDRILKNLSNRKK